MKKYDSVIVDIDYVNVGLTGLNSNIHEWLSAGLKYHDSMEGFTKGMVKFFKTCFKKSIYFELELKGQRIYEMNSDRLYFFKADFSNINNGTVQVYTCFEDGTFDWKDSKKIMSLDKFIKCFRAMLEDMEKKANTTE